MRMQELFDKTTIASFAGSWITIFLDWFTAINVDSALKVCIMGATLVLGMMKIYDQYLITKKRKDDSI